jgi:lysophospholipase L1-like esterase
MQHTLAKLKRAEQVTVVAFGDSITEETFHTRGQMNWVALLREAIFETYGHGVCQMINSGKCGSSYREGLTRIERDVLRFQPDLVILAFGMNDASRGLPALEEFEKEVRETVRIIREKCGSEILIRTPNPVVTLNGLPLPTEQPRPGQVWEAPFRPLRQYSEVLVRLTKELGCACVDHYTLWTLTPFSAKHRVADPGGLWLRMGDAIHPGALGHRIFFRELASLFEVPERFPWEE